LDRLDKHPFIPLIVEQKKGNNMRKDNWWSPGLITAICFAAIIGLMVVGYQLDAFGLRMQHDVVNPQIRQNMVDDPAITIQNRKDFHSKIAEIISADNNILVDLNNNVSGNDLVGVEQIRATAINAYNANAGNPDLSKSMEPWMPKSITMTPLPSKTGDATTALNNEITALQQVITKDQQGGIN